MSSDDISHFRILL